MRGGIKVNFQLPLETLHKHWTSLQERLEAGVLVLSSMFFQLTLLVPQALYPHFGALVLHQCEMCLQQDPAGPFRSRVK